MSEKSPIQELAEILAEDFDATGIALVMKTKDFQGAACLIRTNDSQAEFVRQELSEVLREIAGSLHSRQLDTLLETGGTIETDLKINREQH